MIRLEPVLSLIVTSFVLGSLLWSTSALPDGDPNIGGVTILTSKAEIRNGDCYSYEATAVMEAPPRSVYDALASRQDALAPQRTIESPDHRSKILEYDHIGGMDPPAGHHVVYRVQCWFDPEHLTFSTRVLNDQRHPDNTQYALSPIRNGTSTLVYYRVWQCARERRGEKPRTTENLDEDLSVGLKFTLENIERPIRYAEAPPAPPQFRDGRRVYPTPLPTPESPK